MVAMSDELFASPKSRLVTMLLAFFLGVFGVHRFYVGKVGTGLAMLFTLGGLGIWWLADNIMILAGSFRDKEGLLVSNWEPETERLAPPGTAGAILDELDQLRADVAELQERLDFAERMLADPDRNTERGR
jgi:hypothetical protein